MTDQQDAETRLGLWIVLALVALLVISVVFGVVLRHRSQAAAPVTAVSASASAGDAMLDALLDGPITGDKVGVLYFEMGAAALPADAASTIEQVKKALDASPGRKLVISGFHDASGDPAKNAELAKARALAVREALKAAGAEPARISLRKPESTTGDGSAEEARRVELRLVE